MKPYMITKEDKAIDPAKVDAFYPLSSLETDEHFVGHPPIHHQVVFVVGQHIFKTTVSKALTPEQIAKALYQASISSNPAVRFDQILKELFGIE